MHPGRAKATAGRTAAACGWTPTGTSTRKVKEHLWGGGSWGWAPSHPDTCLGAPGDPRRPWGGPRRDGAPWVTAAQSPAEAPPAQGQGEGQSPRAHRGAGGRLTSPVGLAQVREPPHVAQPHGKPEAAQEVLALVVPLGPPVLRVVPPRVRSQGLGHAVRVTPGHGGRGAEGAPGSLPDLRGVWEPRAASPPSRSLVHLKENQWIQLIGNSGPGLAPSSGPPGARILPSVSDAPTQPGATTMRAISVTASCSLPGPPSTPKAGAHSVVFKNCLFLFNFVILR